MTRYEDTLAEIAEDLEKGGLTMADCKHEFIYDELHGQAVCEKCGYVLTKWDKQAALDYSMAMLRAEEAEENG